jgi:hypothetical protein
VLSCGKLLFAGYVTAYKLREKTAQFTSLAAVEKKFPGDRERLARMSLIEGNNILCFDLTLI